MRQKQWLRRGVSRVCGEDTRNFQCDGCRIWCVGVDKRDQLSFRDSTALVCWWFTTLLFFWPVSTAGTSLFTGFVYFFHLGVLVPLLSRYTSEPVGQLVSKNLHNRYGCLFALPTTQNIHSWYCDHIVRWKEWHVPRECVWTPLPEGARIFVRLGGGNRSVKTKQAPWWWVSCLL